jgi:hypothetical protein
LSIDFDLNEDNAATVEILGGAMNSQSGQPAIAGYAVPLLPLASVGGLGLIGLVAYLRKRKQLKSA